MEGGWRRGGKEGKRTAGDMMGFLITCASATYLRLAHAVMLLCGELCTFALKAPPLLSQVLLAALGLFCCSGLPDQH